MPSIEIHKNQISEHTQEINDAVAIGLEKRPATLGLHVSACSISLVEIYLHTIGKISLGTMIKHEWFKQPIQGQKIAPLAERKLGSDFEHKDEIFALMYVIEENRNKLIYGKPTKAAIEATYESFYKLHALIKDKLNELGVEIE